MQYACRYMLIGCLLAVPKIHGMNYPVSNQSGTPSVVYVAGNPAGQQMQGVMAQTQVMIVDQNGYPINQGYCASGNYSMAQVSQVSEAQAQIIGQEIMEEQLEQQMAMQNATTVGSYGLLQAGGYSNMNQGFEHHRHHEHNNFGGGELAREIRREEHVLERTFEHHGHEEHRGHEEHHGHEGHGRR